MVKQLAAEVVFARRGGKLTPRHAIFGQAEDSGGRHGRTSNRAVSLQRRLPPASSRASGTSWRRDARRGVPTMRRARCFRRRLLHGPRVASAADRRAALRRRPERQRLERYAQPPPLARPSRREICGRVQAAQDSGHCEMEPPLRKRRKTGGASSTRPSVALSSCCLTGSPRRSCTRLTGGDELQDAGWLASTLSSRRYSHV
jgi:hypothetical protein